MTSRSQGRERSDSRIAPGRGRCDTLQDDGRVISNGAASAGMVRAPLSAQQRSTHRPGGRRLRYIAESGPCSEHRRCIVGSRSMTGRHHSAARLGAVLADAGRPVRAFARMLRDLTRRGCPSAARQRVASSTAHPANAPTQVCPAGVADCRVAFLLGTFLWRSKEQVPRPPGRDPAPALKSTANTIKT